MNKKLVSTFVLLGCALFSLAQTQDDLVRSVKSSFKNSSAKDLEPYLGSRTEIAFDSDKIAYDKDKAEQTLDKFLADNKPKDFQLLHQGSSKEGIKFYIGELATEKGTYRILIYLKNNVSKQVIETIDISKE